MHADMLQGQWKHIRGEGKPWWGDLTDDDLERMAGERDKLVGRLQERYGYTREYAETDVDRRFRAYDRVTREGRASWSHVHGRTDRHLIDVYLSPERRQA